MSLHKTHTIIISDLHLGSLVARPRAVMKLLKNIKFKKLILLGDIFESLNFSELTKEDWELLMYFGELAKKRKVRWIIGNHDKGLTKFFSSLTSIKIYKQYKWRYDDKKYLAIHGHQFDNFWINNMFLSIIANKIYNFIQLVDFEDKRISRFIKKKSKGWLRISKKVAQKAVLYGRLNGVDAIFCGHTHKAMHIKKRGIEYYNSGCWVDIPSTYITINYHKIKIHKAF